MVKRPGRWVVCRIYLPTGAGGTLGPVWDVRKDAAQFAERVGGPWYKTFVVKIHDGGCIGGKS